MDLDAVPAAAARIAIVLAVRPGLGPGTTFGVFASIRGWLADAAGQPLLVSLPLASRGETAMILAELYRHRGQWKFRAVGQGFAAGLPALAAHFGLRLPEPASNERPADGMGQRREPARPGGLASFSGTGFCIHPEGYVLTNHHVIEGASEILARSPRQRCRLEPVFADPTNDLALLRSDCLLCPAWRCSARVRRPTLGRDGDRGRLSAGRLARVGAAGDLPATSVP
ncbi:MAG: TerD family protein [Candidatus Competibacteraceae bacterium]